MLDPYKVREDFPILKTGIIYLDSTATSLTPIQVLEEMERYYLEFRANVGRGLYEAAERATSAYEESRKKIASFIGATKDEVVMVKNTTEAINLVAHSLKWRRGQKVVTTLLEHHSNYLPWLRCVERYGVKVEVVKPTAQGLIEVSDLEKAVDDSTRLVAMTHVSNVLGTITPVEEAARIAHEHGALILLDGAQSVPSLKVDVSKLKCDFLAFSGHKMCGPTGSGCLYISEEASRNLDPIFVGGGAVDSVEEGSFSLLEGPLRFEAGTPAIAEAIGLSGAVEYLNTLGMENVEAHERRLAEKLHEELSDIEGVEIYGPEPKYRLGITSFNIKGLDSHEAALLLDSMAKIAVRSGLHCAHPLVKQVLKQPKGTVRASTYIYNTREEIEKLVSTIEEICRSLFSR